MASGRLADYLGKGDAADRPASLDLHPEAVGFYYATDTGKWSAWNGSQWLEDIMAGGGGGLDVAGLLLSSVDELGPEDSAELPDLDPAGTLTGGAFVYLVDDAGNSVRATLSELKAFINTDPTIIPSSNPWRGALVKRTSPLSLPSGTPLIIPWQAASGDANGMWSIGAPTRLVVPPGVTRVRIGVSIRFSSNSSGVRSVYISKNGAVFDGRGRALANAVSGEEVGIQAFTWDVPVVAGDYFEAVPFQNSGSTLDILADTQTWFGMTVVEATP